MVLGLSEKEIGGILLIAGCSIGAAMLGLPVLSALAGFVPSTFYFILSWLFMTTTGLLLLEVNLWFRDEVSIISMVGKTLGTKGQGVAWFLYLFLFYSLMVAYAASSGALFSGVVEDFGFFPPKWIGSLLFIFLSAFLIFYGTASVDKFNRFLMAGLILSFFSLIFMGAEHVKWGNLTHQNWSASYLVIPAMIISFGFHNLIPSLTTYFDHKRKSLIKVVVIGSLIPLVSYLIWQWLILGIVPIGGFREALDGGELATQALKKAVRSSWVILIAEHFAFFAVTSSFLSVALSFVDFLADGLGIRKTRIGKCLLILISLAPPFICAMIFPEIFLIALNYAGAYGAVILFGVMPAMMVWRGRYRLNPHGERCVPGGKGVLAVIIILALSVVAMELVQDLFGN